jgi:hypothetical protein
MKSTLSLTTLIVSLVALPLSVTAQERAPLAMAATREAGRLDAIQFGDDPPESDWSPVVALASATNIVVTVRGSKPVRGPFVHADESALTVRTGRWQVIQTIAREDVQEIRTGPTGGRRALGFLVGVGGAFGGMLVGGTIGGAGSDAEDLGGVALGATAGLVGGAVLGYKAVTHTKGKLIYRMP